MKTFQLAILLLFLAIPAGVQAQKDTIVAAGTEYRRGKLSRTIWGDHYRETWATPVKAPIFDVSQHGGGLTPKELGGGKQTRSLKFEGKDGNEYVGRSINKDPAEAIPELLRNTYAEKVVKDQVSSAHPYGSLVVPKLAEAVGVYHTSPKLFYVPRNPNLGEFSDKFNDMLITLEIRPDEDAVSLSHYDDVNGTDKVFAHMQESSLRQADQKEFLKNRLFDMLLGDWDRHADQFKWGEIKDGKKRTYHPLPKDRDQVFTLFDGIIPTIASQKWAVRELEHFDHDFYDIKGLNHPARNLDRRLLTSLSKQDWIDVVSNMQKALTDDVIRAATLDLPSEVYPLTGKELEEKLKSRRDIMDEVALKYYSILSEKVNITGSDENETYITERLPDGNVLVKGYNTSTGERIKIFERLFDYEETKEVRIYGMGGADSLFVSGQAGESMKIRLLPGTGKDYVSDLSGVDGLFNKTKVYTHKNSGAIIQKSGETRIIRVESDTVYAYNDSTSKYSYFGPIISVEYNVDDGLFIGGGVAIRRAGFRKEPWGSTHKATVNFSTNSGSYNARYKGIFYSKIAKFWDIGLLAEGFGPKYFLNYFGQGNETPEVYNIGYYRMRMASVTVMPSVIHRVSKNFNYEFGPFGQYFRVDDTPGRFFVENEFPEENEVNVPYKYAGGFLQTNLSTANHPLFPSRGVRWTNSGRYSTEIEGTTNFFDLGSDLAVYYTPLKSANLVFAHRLGGSHILGDYRFFQSNFLGGTTNLRGFRRERFAGRSAAFLNNDIRLLVGRFNFYFVAGEWGVFGFADAGRVWADNETSDLVHYSYGPGAWLNVLNLFLISGSYGFNEQGDGLFLLNSGFLF